MKKVIIRLILVIIIFIALLISAAPVFAKHRPITYEPEETIFVPDEDYWDGQWKYV